MGRGFAGCGYGAPGVLALPDVDQHQVSCVVLDHRSGGRDAWLVGSSAQVMKLTTDRPSASVSIVIVSEAVPSVWMRSTPAC